MASNEATREVVARSGRTYLRSRNSFKRCVHWSDWMIAEPSRGAYTQHLLLYLAAPLVLQHLPFSSKGSSPSSGAMGKDLNSNKPELPAKEIS